MVDSSVFSSTFSVHHFPALFITLNILFDTLISVLFLLGYKYLLQALQMCFMASYDKIGLHSISNQ